MGLEFQGRRSGRSASVRLAAAVLLALGLCACRPGDWQWLDERIDHAPESDTGSDARRPVLCGTGPILYAVWEDDREGAPRVYMNRSLDGGQTWEDKDIEISVDTPAGASAANPALGCDGGLVAVAWEDDRDGTSGAAGIYLRASRDGGVHWPTSSVRVTADAFGDWRSAEPRVAVRGDTVHLLFADDRSGSFDIFHNRSVDGGETWPEPEQRLDTDRAGASWSAQPVLALGPDEEVVAVWLDRRDGANDLYLNRSLSGGAAGSWLSEDLRIDTHDAAGASDAFAPAIAIDDAGRLVLAWHDNAFGAPDILTVAGDIDTLSLSEPSRLDTDLAGQDESRFADLAFDDAGELHAVFRDERFGGSRILYTRSSDGGISWLPEEIDLSRTLGIALNPALAAGPAGRVAVVWPSVEGEGAESWEDLWLRVSMDGGQTWDDARRVEDRDAGAARSVHPGVAVSADRVAVVWEEWRTGNADIYSRDFGFEVEE